MRSWKSAMTKNGVKVWYRGGKKKGFFNSVSRSRFSFTSHFSLREGNLWKNRKKERKLQPEEKELKANERRRLKMRSLDCWWWFFFLSFFCSDSTIKLLIDNGQVWLNNLAFSNHRKSLLKCVRELTMMSTVAVFHHNRFPWIGGERSKEEDEEVFWDILTLIKLASSGAW